jgi:2-dehydropantoate 2-reductase
MRILMFGAGVVGHIYGSQLAESGHQVALYVRPGATDHYPQGLSIRLQDFRKARQDLLDVPQGVRDYSTNYRPRRVDSFSAEDAWDLIIVCTASTQLAEALPVIAAGAGSAHVLFFQNNWNGIAEVSQHLSGERYLFGYPQAGGAFDDEGIQGVIRGPVLLGEADGAYRPRLEKVAAAFTQAGFTPTITREMLPWLWTHYAITSVMVGGAARAGSYSAFVQNSHIVKDAMLAAREALAVVRARGVDISRMDEARPFDLPTWMGVPALKFLRDRPVSTHIGDLQRLNASAEMVQIYREVVSTGRKLNVPMPHLEAFGPDVDVMGREGEARQKVA